MGDSNLNNNTTQFTPEPDYKVPPSQKIRIAVYIVIAIILLFYCYDYLPDKMNSIYEKNCSKYLTSEPTNGHIYYKIETKVEGVERKGSVGNEWSFSHYLINQKTKSEKEFSDSDIISLTLHTTKVVGFLLPAKCIG